MHLVNLLFSPGEESLETETALPVSHGFLGGVSTAGVGGNETPLANLPGESGESNETGKTGDTCKTWNGRERDSLCKPARCKRTPCR